MTTIWNRSLTSIHTINASAIGETLPMVQEKDSDPNHMTAPAVRRAMRGQARPQMVNATQLSDLAAKIEQQAEKIQGLQARLEEYEKQTKETLDTLEHKVNRMQPAHKTRSFHPLRSLTALFQSKHAPASTAPAPASTAPAKEAGSIPPGLAKNTEI